MKISKIGIACGLALVTSSAWSAEVYNKDGAKLDLYGMIEGSHYISNDPSMSGDQSFARFGFTGESQISENVTGYGKWQIHTNASNPESNSGTPRTRYAFAGIKVNDYGSFDYGRNLGVIFDSLSFTDMQPEFDAMTYGADQFMFHRANGLATYRNTDFFGLVEGLNFALQYQGKNDGGGEPGARDVLRQNGDGYGMSLSYNFDNGVSLVGAMSSSKRTEGQNSQTSGIMGNGDRADAYSGAIKYDQNNIYLAAMYTQGYNVSRFGSASGSSAYGYANKSETLELYGHYLFDNGLEPFVAYNVLKGKNLGSYNGRDYDSQNLVKFVDVGASYYFNKNINIFVDYMINLVDANDFTRSAGMSTDDVLALGVVYQF